MNTHLNELRGLRDSYGRKAVIGLTAHYGPGSRNGWGEVISETKVHPTFYCDGLRIMLVNIPEMDVWAAVSRFAWLCEKVQSEEAGCVQCQRGCPCD